MKTSEFDYHLPPELIAQYPAAQRDESRLLVLNRSSSGIEHRMFRDVVDYLDPADALVLNESQVIPARFLGRKEGTGGQVEMFLLRELAPSRWEVLVRPAARVREGTVLVLGEGAVRAEVTATAAGGKREVRLLSQGPLDDAIAEFGQVPLPPYIDREPEEIDRTRYQTVYARVPGAVAAPTAGLHFTAGLLEEVRNRGVSIVPLLLHVGLGTFRPISVDDPREHEMESEYYELSDEVAQAIAKARARGGRTIAVGTTTVRALESVAEEDGRLVAGGGWTDLFIRSPYTFRVTDALITNFHLPRSTLLMLVCAFAGRERVLHCYREAVRMRYRFYSYGDAMLIL